VVDGELLACDTEGRPELARLLRRHGLTGVNWVLLFNASVNPDTDDIRIAGDAVREVRQTVERLEKRPDIDLFNEYRWSPGPTATGTYPPAG
jgi:hypothetical protein